MTLKPEPMCRVRHARVQIEQATIDRDEQVAKAKKGLQYVEEPRNLRAHLAEHQRNLEEVMIMLNKLRSRLARHRAIPALPSTARLIRPRGIARSSRKGP